MSAKKSAKKLVRPVQTAVCGHCRTVHGGPDCVPMHEWMERQLRALTREQARRRLLEVRQLRRSAEAEIETLLNEETRLVGVMAGQVDAFADAVRS